MSSLRSTEDILGFFAKNQTPIEACGTRHGVLVGPLMTELVGFEERIASFSQVLIEHTSTTSEAVARAPPTGIWHLEENSTVRFLHQDFRPQSIADESAGLFFRTIDAGQAPPREPASGGC